ncbi:hypothetical protein MNBD_GAMMA17-124 [hydrothermal vent metagenome]|uniref:Globin-sensor domain-containing protein n=1 Tax=hydrothermal vent metagenome TaxID=652676 RepID=A0A3B1A3B8_9ZZZZ
MSRVKELLSELSPLLNYTKHDWEILQEEATLISSWIPDIISVFYETVYASSDTNKIFHEGERSKLEKTLEVWLLSLVSGQQEDSFWEHQWIIALLHVQRGVHNLYMLGMMCRVQQIVLEKCMLHYEKERAAEVYNAFHKITSTVAALIAECYGEVLLNSTEDGLSRVGMNPALLQRIKDVQIKKMLAEARQL